MMNATWHRITRYTRNAPAVSLGEWSVRIEGGNPQPGDCVTVPSRGGRVSHVTLVWDDGVALAYVQVAS